MGLENPVQIVRVADSQTGELRTAPMVEIGNGGRPESATRVRIADWEGPLGVLLSLIEARQLDVLSVPLATLAEDYLDALASIADDRIGNISAFVAVASQLILIKSRAMLPRQSAVAGANDVRAGADELDDPEAELRARLVLYRAYRDAGLELERVAHVRIGLFPRQAEAARAAGLAGASPVAAPPLPPAILGDALDGLARILPPPKSAPELVPRTVTLTQRAEIIRAALRNAPTIVLQELLRGVRDRVVVAVTFLAMLELMKRREIVVEQAEAFGPILARRTTAAERATAGIGRDVEETPFDESLGTYA